MAENEMSMGTATLMTGGKEILATMAQDEEPRK